MRPLYTSIYQLQFRRHMQAFAEASHGDYPSYDNQSDLSTPVLCSGPPSPSNSRIRKVTALSDFAPVNVKVKR